MRKCIYLFLFNTLLITECKVPYNPPSIPNNAKYLVVDGFINTGSGPTTIKLSRTTNLSDSNFSPELNAHVAVVDDLSDAYPLAEQGNGIYTLAQLPADYQRKYQLDIITTDGKEYRSDPVDAKPTPQIDSLNWYLDGNGVHIFVNTHDAQNDTRYYRWTYAETWEIRSAYSSLIKYQDSQMVTRPSSEQIWRCWPTDSSTEILIATTQGLSNDIIFQQPITLIPSNSAKMRILYSIIVYQYAIDEAGFNYWQLMKKNTEQLGSLFAPLPSQISGNIHCLSNSLEPVLGYVNASSVTQQRIFIDRDQLPNWQYVSPYECDTAVLHFVPPNQIVSFFEGDYYDIPITILRGGIIEAGPIQCVDCTYNGGAGSNQIPSYWP